jgi:hypothetical protein
MNTQFIPPCPAICETCAENPAHVDTDAIIVFCPHHHYGGFLTLSTGQWMAMGPFEDDAAFRRAFGFALMRQLKEKSVSH